MSWKDVEENIPSTLTEWDQKIKEAGLHNKYCEQLYDIYTDAVERLPVLEKELAEAIASSDKQVQDNGDGTFSVVSRAEERQEEIDLVRARLKRKKAIIRLCKMESRIRRQLKRNGKVFPDTPERLKGRGKKLTFNGGPHSLPQGLDRNPV